MKKLISVLLTIALLMMTAAVSAEAVGSKTAEDIAAMGSSRLKATKMPRLLSRSLKPEKL